MMIGYQEHRELQAALEERAASYVKKVAETFYGDAMAELLLHGVEPSYNSVQRILAAMPIHGISTSVQQ